MALVAWALTGDPVRALAVLVVATPCPLILAAPIAVTGGLSRAASYGGDRQGRRRPGTPGRGSHLAVGQDLACSPRSRPVVIDVIATGSAGADELLRLVAALDQLSPHVAAYVIVGAVEDERAMDLPSPRDVDEVPAPATW